MRGMPNMFFTNTSTLVGLIHAKYPRLDPAPLQDVYSAVSAWHEVHSAKCIPPQVSLHDTMERAMMLLQAVELEIGLRATESKAQASVRAVSLAERQSVQERNHRVRRAVAEDLRKKASHLKAESPQPDSLDAKANQSKRLAKEFAEGGRLVVAAIEAGAFAGDDLIVELITQYKCGVEHMEKAGVRDALAHSRLELFLAVEQRWLSAHHPNLANELSGGGYYVHAYEHYAKVMEFLAELIEKELEAQGEVVAAGERMALSESTAPAAQFADKIFANGRRLHAKAG